MKGVSHCSKFVWFYFIFVELWWSKNVCSLEESKSYKWVNECYFTIIYVLVFIHAYEIALVFIFIYYYYYFSLFQPGLIKIRTSVHFLCNTILCHFAAVSKRNVHWVALKHRFNTWTLAHFYYVDIGTYCCFYYITTDMYCGGSEFKYPGSVPKS